jgi:2-dehydropantoate 2-reductase
MGSLYAGLLALTAPPEDEIWLVGGPSTRPHLETIAQHGLRLGLAPPGAQAWACPYPTQADGSYYLHNLKLAHSAAEVRGPVDLVLVLVKSYRTAAAAEQAATLLGVGGLVLTLQNGLGNAEQLIAVLGADCVAQGVTSLGATLVEPGHVRFAGLGQTALGLPPTGLLLLETLSDRLDDLRLPVILSQEVTGLVWAKLVINSAINPLTALLGCRNGQLLENPAALELLDAVATETARLAEAAGISLPYPPEQASEQARHVAALTAANFSSMLSDIQRSRPTEIEVINGAIVTTAERLNLSAPYNRSLYLLVKARTASLAT